MTAYVTFKCNDTLPSGMPCRGGTSVPVTTTDGGGVNLDAAWDSALAAGWSDDFNDTDAPYPVLDYCPSCTRRRGIAARE